MNKKRGEFLVFFSHHLNTHKVDDCSLADLFYPRHHSDARWHSLEGLGQSDQRRCAEVGHVLALYVHHLVSRLQASEVGTAALHHRQDVAGPSAT